VFITLWTLNLRHTTYDFYKQLKWWTQYLYIYNSDIFKLRSCLIKYEPNLFKRAPFCHKHFLWWFWKTNALFTVLFFNFVYGECSMLLSGVCLFLFVCVMFRDWSSSWESRLFYSMKEPQVFFKQGKWTSPPAFSVWSHTIHIIKFTFWYVHNLMGYLFKYT
jgi:hypothetical protein